jgi:hypothetical protein
MSYRSLQVALILLGTIFLSSRGYGNKSAGYRCLISYGNGFIAAGSGGHIDWISESGRKTRSEIYPGENFNCLLDFDGMIVAAGEKGSVMISSDKGVFSKVESGTARNINSLTSFRGIIIAGADQGEIIAGDGKGPFKKIQLALKGNIVSISSRSSECFGVTDAGEIIHSVNGSDWEITDFNKVYSGYYKPCFFTAILVTGNRIAAAGVRVDGSPVLMLSNQGNVWTERTLFYTDDQGAALFLEGSPRAISYYETGDEFYLACTGGKIMQLPSCSHCNKLAVVSAEDIEGISNIENKLIVIGGNFLVRVLNTGF